MTRRSFLSLLASLPFAGSVFSGCAAAGALPRVRILHMTDLHYIAPSLTDNGPMFTRVIEQADGKVMQYSDQMAEAFVRQALLEQPDLVILSGDLTFNGARESHEALAQKLRRLTAAGIPVYVLPGNHDLQCAWAARYRDDRYEHVPSVTPAEFAALYGEFGYGQALARDEHSSSYMAEPVPGLRLLMVDCNTPASPGKLTESTLAFAEAQLKAARRAGAKVLAVSHQPILNHNTLFADSFAMGGRAPLQALYEKYHVRCNLCGHMHMQHIAHSEGGLTDIVGSALSVSPSQFGLLTLEQGAAEYHTAPLDVAHWAWENHIPDPQGELTEFTAVSANFFKQTCLRQARQTLDELKQNRVTRAEAVRLSHFYANVNASYFAGRADQMPWDEQLYQGWLRTGAFTAVYLQSLRDEPKVDCTQAAFEF